MPWCVGRGGVDSQVKWSKMMSKLPRTLDVLGGGIGGATDELVVGGNLRARERATAAGVANGPGRERRG